jgi:hypothetical protein
MKEDVAQRLPFLNGDILKVPSKALDPMPEKKSLMTMT